MHTKFKILMLVRHGQSTGNVDQPTHDHASIPLTALGEEQAKKLSTRIDVRPDLIVASSFRRAQQTAEPLREKFPDVPVEIWPDTAEFTYLALPGHAAHGAAALGQGVLAEAGPALLRRRRGGDLP